MTKGKRGVVPSDHPEDKKSRGFSEAGIPSKDAPLFFENTKGSDNIGKGTNETGPVNVRK